EGPSTFNKELTFEFRRTGSTAFQRTVIPAADGTYTVTGIPAGNYNVWIKGAKWLAKVVPANVTAGNATNVNAALAAGDVNNDNGVDISDLGDLANAFNSAVVSPGVNGPYYDVRADFNEDGSVDIEDLGALALNFNATGDP